MKGMRFLPNFIGERVASNPDLRRILGNSGWMASDKIIRKILNLLVIVMLARYLGPDLFGKFSFALAFLMIITPLSVMAMDATSVRRIVGDPEAIEEVMGAGFSVMLAGGAVALLIGLSGAWMLRPGDVLMHWLVGIMACGTVVNAFAIIEYRFYALEQYQYNVFAKTSTFALISLSKIFMILLGAPLIAFAWAVFAESLFASIALLAIYYKKGYRVQTWQYSWRAVKSMLSDSWPLVFAGFLTTVYLRIDQIMLGNMAGTETLANYALAVQFSEVWIFIPVVLCGGVFPAILAAEKVSHELFYSRMQRLYGLVALVSYAFAIPVTFFAEDIIVTLFGTTYQGAAPLLTILVWTGLFTSLGAARHLFIIARNWTRINLISIAIGCTMNITLNMLLIPAYEAKGAVLATFVSYWFTVHGSCFLFKPLRPTGIMMAKAMIFPKFFESKK